MPLVWGAEGHGGLEAPSRTQYLEIPLGVHKRYLANDKVVEKSPDTSQKNQIFSKYVTDFLETSRLDPSRISLTILDEVQQGGTITTATKIARSIIEKIGLRPTLNVIAAQDTRKRLRGQPKNPRYLQLSSNSTHDTITNVIPMPLIGTDISSLLDTVTLQGDGTLTGGMANRLEVTRNTDAERVFRTLGSLARNENLRHDQMFMWEFLNEHTKDIIGESAVNTAVRWTNRLIVAMDTYYARSG